MNLTTPTVSIANSLGEASRHLKPIASPESDVQIAIAHLDSLSPREILDLRSVLDASEKKRATEFRAAKDEHRYIAAHGLLRYFLGEVLEHPVSEIAFDLAPNGKPQLGAQAHDVRGVYFNLSHSNGWAIFAVCWEREVGVDLEAAESLPSREDELFDLAARVFSKRELANWRRLTSESSRRAAFLQAWTRKEAYVKAIGEGFHRDLAEIDGAPEGWIVHDLDVPDGFAGALAAAER